MNNKQNEQFDWQRKKLNYELDNNFLKIIFDTQKIKKITREIYIKDEDENIEDYTEDTEINTASIMQLYEIYQEKQRIYDLITSRDVDLNALRYRITYSFYNDVLDKILQVRKPHDDSKQNEVIEKLHTKRI